jgi:hypothetical protein
VRPRTAFLNPIITAGIAAICLVGIAALQHATLQASSQQVSQAEHRRQEKAEQATLRLLQNLPAFGFNNLLANWSFLKFIQYYGDTAVRDQVGYALVPEYFEVIVRNDPRFVRAYLYLSTASSLFAGRPDRTVALMGKGLESLEPTLPGAYYVWLYKGVDELLFLGNNHAAQHSYAMAAKWASIRGDTAVAARAQETAQFLANNPNSNRAQASAWGMILSNSRDDATRKLALSRIQALGGKVSYRPQGNALILTVQLPEED